MRAIAIALFYAFGTGVGGVVAPTLFGALIEPDNACRFFGVICLAAH